MKLLVVTFPTGSQGGPRDEAVREHVREAAHGLGVDLAFETAEEGVGLDADLILSIGSDRDVLATFQALGDADVPILGVSDATGSAFLTDLTLDGLPEGLRRVAEGRYRLEPCTRLAVTVDGTPRSTALNEVAIFPARTAVLMESTLAVDGEEVTRDYSDGVLVATPTGSSAYALSAGGPLVFPESRVFVVVAVNPMDTSRRPLVVPDTAVLEVRDIAARSECEVVIDGLARHPVKETVALRGGPPGQLVRMDGGSPRRMEALRRVRTPEEVMKMPPSAKLVLKTIEYEGPLTARDVATETRLPPRTVRHALSLLVEKGLVARSPHLRDLRSDIYSLAAKGEEEGPESR